MTKNKTVDSSMYNNIVGIATETVEAGSLITMTTSGTFSLASTSTSGNSIIGMGIFNTKEKKDIEDKYVKDCTIQELLCAVRKKVKNEKQTLIISYLYPVDYPPETRWKRIDEMLDDLISSWRTLGIEIQEL